MITVCNEKWPTKFKHVTWLLRQPRENVVNSSLSPLSSSITPSLFHSKLKTYLFQKSFQPWTPYPSTGLTSQISGCFCFLLLNGFYRMTACNATHGIAVAILSVCPSVRCVYCDKTKRWTVDIWYHTKRQSLYSFLTPTLIGGQCPLPSEICTQ